MRTIARFVAKFLAWAIFPTVVLLWFPSPWMWLGFIAPLFFLIGRWIERGTPLPSTRANLPLFIFLLWVAFSFAVTPASDLAVITVGQVLVGVTVFFVLRDFTPPMERALWIAGALVLLGVAFALVAPFTVNWTPSKLFGLPEFYDKLWFRLPEKTNSNILAGALAPMVPIALALVRQNERRWRVLGATALAPILLIGVLLQSRGAFLGLAAGIVVWLALYNRWMLPLALAGILGLMAVDVFFGGASLATLLYGEAGATIAGTMVMRQDLWREAVLLIRQAPLWGIGLGAYPRVSAHALPHAHNLFLQIALDTGVIGLAAFLGVVGVAMRAAWSSYRAKLNRHLAIGVLAAFVVLMVHGLGDVIVWGTAKASIVLWILLALAMGLDEN
jgi:putative inorganic carbon (HCO3(-)) transporter